MYQSYQLTDYRSLKEFIGKLLTKFEITFDEEMSKSILEKAISELAKIEFDKEDVKKENVVGINDMLVNLKSHIDKRFIELIDRQINKTIVKKNEDCKKENKVEDIIYTITIKINFPEYKGERLLEIGIYDTVRMF